MGHDSHHITYLPIRTRYFHPDSWDIAESERQVCDRYALEGVTPFDPVGGRAFNRTAERAREIYQGCVELLNGCNGLIVNMSPFRGPSIDIVAAFEMGYILG